ncbi:hypothetical protein PVAP13_9KG529600 [Panicum virgatum]|uniref:Uncharacterized protein n=1 Tax=Panicum virgatum TaxID=38727 RepID=A0A8T0NVU4_PANVG|nr:hypothetical protein PVAP13_9KG529600 [Panicum virgatum]
MEVMEIDAEREPVDKRKAGWITETAMRLQSGLHRLWAEQGCLRLQSVCVPAGGRRKKDEPACVSSESKVTAAGDAETNPSFWSEGASAGRKGGEVATLAIIRPAARPGAAEEQKERDGLLLLIHQNRCRPGPAIELDTTRYVTLQRLQLHDSAFRIFSIVVSLFVLFCCFFQVWSSRARSNSPL